jgi:hypothetical protein
MYNYYSDHKNMREILSILHRATALYNEVSENVKDMIRGNSRLGDSDIGSYLRLALLRADESVHNWNELVEIEGREGQRSI